MQPNGRPHASLTVLASGITASVNDVMRGNGAADMVHKNGIHENVLAGNEFLLQHAVIAAAAAAGAFVAMLAVMLVFESRSIQFRCVYFSLFQTTIQFFFFKIKQANSKNRVTLLFLKHLKSSCFTSL
jgi:hypothetical protein